MAIKNLLIVESPNDGAFIKLLLAAKPSDQLELRAIDESEFMDLAREEGKGLWGKNLETIADRLETIKGHLSKKEECAAVGKIGLILDMGSPPDWDFEKNKRLIRHSPCAPSQG